MQAKAAPKSATGYGGRREYQALLKLHSDAGKQIKSLEHLMNPSVLWEIRAEGKIFLDFCFIFYSGSKRLIFWCYTPICRQILIFVTFCPREIGRAHV